MNFSSTQIAKFVVANYDRANEWPFEQLRRWIAWNMKEGFCLLVGGPKIITGMMLIRPVLHPELYIHNSHYDQEGDTLLIDLCVAVKPKIESLQCLAFATIERFGQRDKIAFQKHGTGPLIVTSMHEHRRKLLRERVTV